MIIYKKKTLNLKKNGEIILYYKEDTLSLIKQFYSLINKNNVFIYLIKLIIKKLFLF